MSERIGFILGGGYLAKKSVLNALKEGFDIYVAGFENITDTDFPKDVKIEYFKIGQIGKIINFFKKNDVKKVVLIGNISHINVFRDVMPDLRGALFLMKMKDKTPDGIFKAVKEELKSEGIDIEKSTRFLLDSTLPKGLICGNLKKDDLEQIEYGYNIAKNIASMDIGLSVVIKDFCVIAVEAVEGTDECIKRAGELLGKKGDFILVKVSRPKQDIRFDLPVIGSKTVEAMYKAGGRLIAAESEKTLVADFDEMIKLAKEKNLTIYGV